jgi:multiple sugar transport system permease protein
VAQPVEIAVPRVIEGLRHRSSMTHRGRERLTGIGLLVPAIALIAVVIGLPFLRALQLSVDRFRINEGIDSERFCGVCNFASLLADPFLATFVRTQAIWMLGATFLPIVAALGVALLFSQQMRFRAFWRAIVLVPWMMPVAAIAVTWRWLYDQQWGIFNYYLTSTGLTSDSLGFLSAPSLLWPSILVVATWMWFPYNYVAILAALQGISPDLYEAGRVDGTGPWTSFRYITFPAIRPLLGVLVILGLIWAANDFTTIFVLTQGGPGVDSTTMPLLVYRTMFRFHDFGKAAAIAVVVMLVSLSFAIVYLRRTRADEP